jgi:Zn-dependent alcohol dehydrogenase
MSFFSRVVVVHGRGGVGSAGIATAVMKKNNTTVGHDVIQPIMSVLRSAIISLEIF